MLTILALFLITAAVPAPVAQDNPLRDVRAKFSAACEVKDAQACAELWRAHPLLVLPAIDADLEGSLKVRESAKGSELGADARKQIEVLHARALFGARSAYDVSGDALILDYASSFVDWDAEQRTAFRSGQKAYGEAQDALKKGDAKAALEAGQRCLAVAAPLGDWWGTAMGYEAIARAKEKAGDEAGALEAWSMARAIDHSLQLGDDEYAALTSIAKLSDKLGRRERARANAELALARAKDLGDAEGTKALEALLAKLAGAK